MRGPQVTPGYLNPRHDRGAMLADGWLDSGDLGRLDADGYLWLTGRAKDLIIRGGHNIDPAIIEDALHAHSEVALAAAVGRPDAYAGEVPVAYVQLRPGSRRDEAELMAHVRERIGERAAIPKAIRIRESLPVTPIGKIFKPALRLAEMAETAKEALAAEGLQAQRVEARSDPKHGSVVAIAAGA